MGDKMFNVLGSIIVLAIVTTLVLPGRQTPGVVKAFFDGFNSSVYSAMGSGK